MESFRKAFWRNSFAKAEWAARDDSPSTAGLSEATMITWPRWADVDVGMQGVGESAGLSLNSVG